MTSVGPPCHTVTCISQLYGFGTLKLKEKKIVEYLYMNKFSIHTVYLHTFLENKRATKFHQQRNNFIRPAQAPQSSPQSESESPSRQSFEVLLVRWRRFLFFSRFPSLDSLYREHYKPIRFNIHVLILLSIRLSRSAVSCLDFPCWKSPAQSLPFFKLANHILNNLLILCH